MPSSLTMVPPIASVCSTRPPVSVLVRAPRALPRGFSRERGLRSFALRLRLASRPCAQGGFACPAAYMLSRGRPEPRLRTLLRRPVGLNSGPEAVQECPPVAHRLRLPASPELPTDPGRISLAQETLGLRRRRFPRRSRYSCQHPHSPALHRRSPSGFAAQGKLPYQCIYIPPLRRIA